MSKARPCLFCHSTSWEQKRQQALGQEKYKTLQADSKKETGLQCCHCHSFFCKPCLALMLDKASRLAPQDPWTTSVRVFLNDGLHSPSFTGSCCEFRVQLKASPKIAKAKLQPPTGVPSYDGHLHYPEYNLLVDSNFSAIDLLALAEQPGLPSHLVSFGYLVVLQTYSRQTRMTN
jgi:hypothetical protein